MKAELKEIIGIPEYYVDSCGRVFSTKTSPRYNKNGELREVKPRIHPSGYLYYGLFKGEGPSKQRLWRRAHRLVWEAWNGKIKQGLEIDHKNGDKHDNCLSNLRVVTHSENMLSAYERRRRNKGCV